MEEIDRKLVEALDEEQEPLIEVEMQCKDCDRRWITYKIIVNGAYASDEEGRDEDICYKCKKVGERVPYITPDVLEINKRKIDIHKFIDVWNAKYEETSGYITMIKAREIYEKAMEDFE